MKKKQVEWNVSACSFHLIQQHTNEILFPSLICFFMFCLIKLQVNRDERVNLIKRKQNKRAKGREWLPLSRVSFRSTSLHFFPRLSSLSFFCLKRMKWGEKGWKKKERWKEKWKKERKEHNSLHSSFICSFIRFTYNVMWVKAWSEPNKKRNEENGEFGSFSFPFE